MVDHDASLSLRLLLRFDPGFAEEQGEKGANGIFSTNPATVLIIEDKSQLTEICTIHPLIKKLLIQKINS